MMAHSFRALQNVKEQTNADLQFRKQNTTDRGAEASTMHLHIEPHVYVSSPISLHVRD